MVSKGSQISNETEPKRLPRFSEHKNLLQAIGEESKNKSKGFKNGSKVVSVEINESKLLEFSYLSACHKRELFSTHRRPLKFGTIISDKDKYYLCIQPLCDGVRLKLDTKIKFPMIELYRKSSSSASSFPACALKIDGNLEFLFLPMKPHQQIVNLEFKPLKEFRDVRTFRNNFESPNKSKKYKWLAELREDITQSIVHKISHDSSRIGTDLYEWMRNRSKH